MATRNGADAGQRPARIIDTHFHYYAPEYQQAWMGWEDSRKLAHHAGQAAWSPAAAVEQLDRNGVQKAILSLPSTPGVWFGSGPDGAARMARLCNDYGARMVRDRPDRFGLFASLPMLDTESSLREIEYAFATLKAEGICLQTNYGDTWPGNEMYRPVFEELDRRRALVYFHPVVANCCMGLSVGTFPAVIEVPHDTTRAIVSLLLAGTLARYRNIRWLFSHAGGTVPMLTGRIDSFCRHRKDAEAFAPRGIEHEFRRLYYDTANATHPASMAALLTLVSHSQVVFGTDYPYVPIGQQLADLRELGLDEEALSGICGMNAMALMPGI